MGKKKKEKLLRLWARGAAVPETEPLPPGTAAHAALGYPPLVLHCQAPSSGGGWNQQHFAFSNLLIPMPVPRNGRPKQKPSGKEPERWRLQAVSPWQDRKEAGWKGCMKLQNCKINKGQSVFSTKDFSCKLLKNFKERKLQWTVVLKSLKHMAQSLQLEALTLVYAVLHCFTFNIFFIPMASKINKSTFPKCYHFFFELWPDMGKMFSDEQA